MEMKDYEAGEARLINFFGLLEFGLVSVFVPQKPLAFFATAGFFLSEST